MLIPEGTVDGTGNSFNTEHRNFEVFSTLSWRKNKPLELLMCKNGLCMKILFVGHGQISLKQSMPSENKTPKGLCFFHDKISDSLIYLKKNYVLHE